MIFPQCRAITAFEHALGRPSVRREPHQRMYVAPVMSTVVPVACRDLPVAR